MSNLSYDHLPDVLKTVRTKPIFAVRLDVEPPTVLGDTSVGVRRIGIITGGSFVGERISGKVQAGGSDWQIVRKDGVITLDVRLSLQTNDGEFICMTYRGYRHGAKDVLERLDRGDVVNPADYYFRTNPLFETASKKYDWLNQVVCVGIGQRDREGPLYSIFEVL